MVLAGTPLLARSAAEAYGLPAMIFFAMAGPTPGSFSNSPCAALLRSTFAPADSCRAAFALAGAGSLGAAVAPLSESAKARATETTVNKPLARHLFMGN